jgi:hypothetical protein
LPEEVLNRANEMHSVQFTDTDVANFINSVNVGHTVTARQLNNHWRHTAITPKTRVLFEDYDMSPYCSEDGLSLREIQTRLRTTFLKAVDVMVKQFNEYPGMKTARALSDLGSLAYEITKDCIKFEEEEEQSGVSLSINLSSLEDNLIDSALRRGDIEEADRIYAERKERLTR